MKRVSVVTLSALLVVMIFAAATSAASSSAYGARVVFRLSDGSFEDCFAYAGRGSCTTSHTIAQTNGSKMRVDGVLVVFHRNEKRLGQASQCYERLTLRLGTQDADGAWKFRSFYNSAFSSRQSACAPGSAAFESNTDVALSSDCAPVTIVRNLQNLSADHLVSSKTTEPFRLRATLHPCSE